MVAMPSDAARQLQWLKELTGLPTASGQEQRVIAWVKRWAARRRDVVVSADRFGNLLLHRRRMPRGGKQRPLIITAHMDHPAFIVTKVRDERTVEASFRGGVADEYFISSRVLLHHDAQRPCKGRIVAMVKVENVKDATLHDGSPSVTIEFDKPLPGRRVALNDVVTWDVGPPRVRAGRLHAPACDDLAGVAAALSAFDALGGKRLKTPVSVLLTRAEEVGFVGAIAACRSGLLPRNARLLCLENSKSFAESPIGGGPIVRVGDRLSTFDPELTYQVGIISAELAAVDRRFQWQRRLMTGGTCEATAFGAFGYTATCLCLPLGNYHNMNEQTQTIAAETIATADYLGLVRLLTEVAVKIDAPGRSLSLRQRLTQRFERQRWLLR
jgi:putative aminopeptidase FrvX